MKQRHKSLLERATYFVLIGTVFYLLFIDAPHEHGAKEIYKGPPKGSSPAAEVGYPAPDITLYGIDGKSYKLSDFRGRPVLLSFWAPWCAPCRREMPSMNRLAEHLNGRLVVLAVVTDFDSKAEVKTLVRTLRFSQPVLLDSQSVAARTYKIQVLPTNLLIDSKGIIRWRGSSRHWDSPASMKLVSELP